MPKFTAIITFGDQERKLQTRPKHREYLQGLLAQGQLHASGPFADDGGALIIYEAADEAEARTMLANDPYTAAGVIADVDLREWNQTLGIS